MAPSRSLLWKYAGGLGLPLATLAALIAWLAVALSAQMHLVEDADRNNVEEWVTEFRPVRQTLPELAREYQQMQENPATPAAELAEKRQELFTHLKALGDPVRKYRDRLPLFPTINYLEVHFRPPMAPVCWDSHLPASGRPARTIPLDAEKGIELRLDYQLHTYAKQQELQLQGHRLTRQLGVLLAIAVVVGAVWVYVFLSRERQRELQEYRQRQTLAEAEQLSLQLQLRREEAERARETAERHALEMKQQADDNIKIVAGGYAHNIKNLLVRPNDLLVRCLDANGLAGPQQQMLHEVRQALGMVGERVQQIMRTVGREPRAPQLARLDLNALVEQVVQRFGEESRRWQLDLKLELAPGPLWIDGDASHLEQAIENLVVNARDATWEQRRFKREQARGVAGSSPRERQELALAAAGWRGAVVLRTRDDGERFLLEVRDNGIGMTEEVRSRCTEAHFSTKRGDAIFEGHSTGMGLGLSFVMFVLERHRATLEIESEPARGATFRLCFPRAGAAV
jgi:signal transduction histidine kinase